MFDLKKIEYDQLQSNLKDVLTDEKPSKLVLTFEKEMEISSLKVVGPLLVLISGHVLTGKSTLAAFI